MGLSNLVMDACFQGVLICEIDQHCIEEKREGEMEFSGGKLVVAENTCTSKAE